jgi:hypothetical protein
MPPRDVLERLNEAGRWDRHFANVDAAARPARASRRGSYGVRRGYFTNRMSR